MSDMDDRRPNPEVERDRQAGADAEQEEINYPYDRPGFGTPQQDNPFASEDLREEAEEEPRADEAE